jgi:hypothetical protein
MAFINGKQIQDATGLSPTEINHAVDLFIRGGIVDKPDVRQLAHPFDFYVIELSPLGKDLKKALKEGQGLLTQHPTSKTSQKLNT